ncbi:MAG: Fe-S-containing hydro-lyase [Deferrisomatales bacterium]|nr:Fe-S-containing hydro-lyase [Deferrisomatales bacterium]
MTRLTTPLTDADVEALSAGDPVLLSGAVYTARDAAHARLVELVRDGKPLPFDVRGQVIYFVGPTPAPPGRPIGSAGPTTSYRMDPYSPVLIGLGLKGMIGKGKRAAEVVEAMKRHKAVYFGATGGAAALIAKRIVTSEIVAYEDLGPEAIRRLEVVDFPATVIIDCRGGDLYAEGRKQYAKVG